MSKIIVRKQEYANNGTHADEIKAVVRDDLITQTLTSDTDIVPSSKAVKDALSTKLELKSLVNQSGTTNASGILTTSLSVSDTVVLAVLCPSSYFAYPLPLNGSVWYVALENYAGQRVANTAISYHLLYVER